MFLDCGAYFELEMLFALLLAQQKCGFISFSSKSTFPKSKKYFENVLPVSTFLTEYIELYAEGASTTVI